VAAVAMVFGALLVLLGVVGYAVADPKSWTALIPALFGAALVGLGALARKEHLRKHAMHAAALVGLVGCVVPAVRALPELGALFSGTAKNPPAVVSQLVMALLCAGFVGLCVKSFVDARRARARREQPGA
jgi:hypothetical protein